MNKAYSVAIFRFCNAVPGCDLAASANINIEAARQQSVIPELGELLHVPIDLHDGLPLSIARNQAVAMCRSKGIHIAVFVNGNVAPQPGWFKTAFDILVKCMQDDDEVAGVAAPCFTSLEFSNAYKCGETSHQGFQENLVPLTLDEAFKNQGCSSVPSIGSQCIMYDARKFDRVDFPPFMDFINDSESNHRIITQSDVYLNSFLFGNEFIFMCTWDMWADINLSIRLGKPLYQTGPQIAVT